MLLNITNCELSSLYLIKCLLAFQIIKPVVKFIKPTRPQHAGNECANLFKVYVAVEVVGHKNLQRQALKIV